MAGLEGEKQMGTTLESLPNADLLLCIVKAERDCPLCDGQGYKNLISDPEDPHHIQSATRCTCRAGKVPILSPELMRLPCPQLYKRSSWPSMATIHELRGINCECQGRTWVPNPDAWAMWRALAEIKVDAALNLSGGIFEAVIPDDSFDETRWCSSEGDDPQRALLLAVAKAFAI